jgi:hypothetical protein
MMRRGGPSRPSRDERQAAQQGRRDDPDADPRRFVEEAGERMQTAIFPQEAEFAPMARAEMAKVMVADERDGLGCQRDVLAMKQQLDRHRPVLGDEQALVETPDPEQ